MTARRRLEVSSHSPIRTQGSKNSAQLTLSRSAHVKAQPGRGSACPAVDGRRQRTVEAEAARGGPKVSCTPGQPNRRRDALEAQVREDEQVRLAQERALLGVAGLGPDEGARAREPAHVLVSVCAVRSCRAKNGERERTASEQPFGPAAAASRSDCDRRVSRVLVGRVLEARRASTRVSQRIACGAPVTPGPGPQSPASSSAASHSSELRGRVAAHQGRDAPALEPPRTTISKPAFPAFAASPRLAVLQLDLTAPHIRFHAVAALAVVLRGSHE